VLETAKKAAHDEVQKMGDALAERLAVLEAARGDPDVLAERLTALEADRIDPAALAEQVRQSLLPAIPDVNAAVTGVREGLAVDLAAVLQTAKQAARDEAQAMADALPTALPRWKPTASIPKPWPNGSKRPCSRPRRTGRPPCTRPSRPWPDWTPG